ncbi:hypothetical protein AJ80_00982 [Polytolypa hystricis UAMH7299]|uniref:Cnl2/NKP2 family protein n=1 Tax=Polytolypa hystricis (strain UAMH7299) TaxID=1447883 RepID=A0A2B7Z2H7_POLH7|nr:hypothetical protein AJ80_00982 [Polytolypa hystricis UAMH7299]
MAPSEESILINFLLSPSPLPTVITLEKFTELFPKRLRAHPQIRVLYRELQHLRTQDIDLVQENINKELRRGERQKQELRNAKAATGVSGMNRHDAMEIDMDIHLFGQAPNPSSNDCHSLETLLPEMERACSHMEKEIEVTEAEAASIMTELNAVVGELSDLRYGKLNKPPGVADDIVNETVKGLKKLEAACAFTAMR